MFANCVLPCVHFVERSSKSIPLLTTQHTSALSSLFRQKSREFNTGVGMENWKDIGGIFCLMGGEGGGSSVSHPPPLLQTVTQTSLQNQSMATLRAAFGSARHWWDLFLGCQKELDILS